MTGNRSGRLTSLMMYILVRLLLFLYVVEADIKVAFDADLPATDRIRIVRALQRYSAIPLGNDAGGATTNYVLFRPGSNEFCEKGTFVDGMSVLISNSCTPGQVRAHLWTYGPVFFPPGIDPILLSQLGTEKIQMIKTIHRQLYQHPYHPNVPVVFRNHRSDECTVARGGAEWMWSIVVDPKCDVVELFNKTVQATFQPVNLLTDGARVGEGNRSVAFQDSPVKGSVVFCIKPFALNETQFSVILDNFTMVFTDDDVAIEPANLFEKKVLKKYSPGFLHFNYSEQRMWISICHRRPFIKVGMGYLMESNTLFLFEGQEETVHRLQELKTLRVGTGYPRVSVAFTKEMIVVIDEAPLLGEITTINILAKGEVTNWQRLPPEGRQLYGAVQKIRFDHHGDAAAINFSLDTKDCILYNKLAEKIRHSVFGSSKMSYIRMTIGKDRAQSPGVPFVLEIWPKGGHRSPIHDHGSTVAVIKVLHGTIISRWYNPLFNNSAADPTFIKSASLYKDNITWMVPDLYQTHQLINEAPHTAAITIQSYSYAGDKREEFFYWRRPNSSTLGMFKPGKDLDYEEDMPRIREEYRKNNGKKRCKV